MDHAYVVVMGDRPPLRVPDFALDVHTARGREMGRGAEHFYAEGAVVEPAAPVHDPYAERAIKVDERTDERRRRRRSGGGQQTLD